MTEKKTTKKKTFAERLLIAQQEASGIGKDSNNAYHKYPYTDCDSMIDYGGQILNLAGLVLYPDECEHAAKDNMMFVKKVFICETLEGEQRKIPIEVPVVSTDRKQADDKASFGSQSSGLAYMMRDLLLIPRGDKFVDIDGTPKSSVSAEDDTEFVKMSPERKAMMAVLVKHDKFDASIGFKKDVLKKYKIKRFEDLTDKQLKVLTDNIKEKTKEKANGKSNN